MLRHEDANGAIHLSNVFANMPYGKRANGFYHIQITHNIIVIYATLTDSEKIEEFREALNNAEKVLNDRCTSKSTPG